MATLPLILALADEIDRLPVAAATPFYAPALGASHYRWPLVSRHHLGRLDKDVSSVAPHIGKDGFQVCMDVANFKPNELTVKVVDNNVVVEGKHEEREDNHGYISRHFVRRYALPKGYEADKVNSTLSSDGVLTVSVPKPLQLEDKSKERIIQIQQTGPAHLNVKENQKDESKDKPKK